MKNTEEFKSVTEEIRALEYEISGKYVEIEKSGMSREEKDMKLMELLEKHERKYKLSILDRIRNKLGI